MKNLLLLSLCFFVLLTSCKEDEDASPEPYAPYSSRIIGTWSVASSTDKLNQTTETYPQSIDPFLITFTNESKLSADGPCNAGSAFQYLTSESGGLTITNFGMTQVFCGALQATWESRVELLLKNAYHSSISGSTLTIQGVNFSLQLKKQ